MKLIYGSEDVIINTELKRMWKKWSWQQQSQPTCFLGAVPGRSRLVWLTEGAGALR
jgi:hypothetical protein